MLETLGSLMIIEKSLKLLQDEIVRASILKTPIHRLVIDRIQIKDNSYDLTPEIHKSLS